MTDSIKFAKHYPKLDRDEFTTIRTKKKDVLNKTVKIITPEAEFLAKGTAIYKTNLKRIDARLLMDDTNTKEVHEAVEELKTHYKDLDDKQPIYVHCLKRLYINTDTNTKTEMKTETQIRKLLKNIEDEARTRYCMDHHYISLLDFSILLKWVLGEEESTMCFGVNLKDL